jgi:tripartite ATP-independent transporter DctM subunit
VTLAAVGLILLALAAASIPLTGLPAFAVLIATAIVGAAIGVAAGAIPVALLTALPNRIVSLLENDLLQALPLYVLTGALLTRLGIIDSIFRTIVAVFRGRASAALCGSIVVGALLGPMNGSVGASVASLSRAVSPRLEALGIAAPTRQAVIAVAATLGVVVPPSLVLILLGDAVLNAHTIASNIAGRTDRIINTQDVFRGALVPAGIFVALCAIAAITAGLRAPPAPANARERASPLAIALAVAAVLFVAAILSGVALGYFYAVEGAALGASVLFIGGLVSRRLSGATLKAVLADTLTTSGMLFALLVAATTFTLVFRALGTDRLLADAIAALPGGSTVATLVVLATIGVAAFALDAFEIIFVLVPVLIPPLLVRVADATWVAVLTLLALQASFLLPPLGYALIMTRTLQKERVPLARLVRALAPFLIAQLAVLAAVVAFPALTHVAQRPGDMQRTIEKPLSDDEAARRLREMVAPPDSEGDRAPP